MARNKTKRVLKKTLLIVGEGEAEKAFLQYLRSLYATGNPKVSIKSAGGKGPKNVITEAISTKDATGYDSAVTLLDTDLLWPRQLVKKAEGKKIVLIGSEPCFEGFLLDILNEARPTPNESCFCKKKMHGLLNGKETEKETYAALFPKDLLDQRKDKLEQLKILINLISGQ
ncbi:RloB domain-containing protein [Vibrio renipiscarius]|uniref:RloB domain-containing protein n=1 Tax=Vibrio renipiscarius TaxID=1461322 RepID=UPI00354F7824